MSGGSRSLPVGRAAGAVAGLVVAGAAGLAAGRWRPGRRRPPPYAGPEAAEPLGSLRGRARTVTTDDGVGLHVEVDDPHGAGSGLTLVFVHGYALNLDCWHFQREALRGQHRLVFYDLRSHGRSDRCGERSSSIDRLGRDLHQVLDAVAATGPVVLVGHSMGGMAVMALAEQAPWLFGDRVVGTALLCTSAGDLRGVTLGLPGMPGRVVHRLTPALLATLARAPSLVESSRRAGGDLAHVLTRRYAFGGAASSELVEFTDQMLSGTPIGVVAAFFPGFAEHDRYAALDALRGLQVLVVGATSDRMTPPEHSRQIADLLPSARLLELEDAGHMALLERADAVNDALAALLDRVLAERAA